MNAADLKLALLIEGIDIKINDLRGLSFKTDKYLHNDRHFVERSMKFLVPQELILEHATGEKLCVGVLVRPDSRFALCISDGVLFLTCDGERLSVPVKFVEEPAFWKLNSTDGVPYYKLLSVPGVNELNIWPWHDCALHYEKQGCKFCTTTATAVQAGTGPKSNVLTVSRIQQSLNTDQIEEDLYGRLRDRSIEAVRAALTLDDSFAEYWLTIISGNLPLKQLNLQHGLFGRLMQDLLASVPQIDRSKTVANLMPPTDVLAIQRIKEAGFQYYMSNLEIWDERLFHEICPGKAIYGREKFLQMLESAVDIFGTGHVWCNFVCGLEPLDGQLAGIEALAKRGVVCGANVFHRDPNVGINWYPNTSFDDIKSYFISAARILRRNNLEPFFGLASRRSSLMWEAYLGLLS